MEDTMRPNLTKRLLAAGKPAIGLFCSTASAFVAEALGHAGYDFVIVDLQHGENNLGNLQSMLQALSSTPATPVVRMPANMAVYIQRSLDLGAYGIVVPLVNTRQEAEAVVQSVRYAPAGARSFGPLRGMLYAGSDYFEKSADELLTMLMLETAEAAKHAEEILMTPGIDGAFVGPNDLAITLGFSLGVPETAEMPTPVEETIQAILRAAKRTGKAAGIAAFDLASAKARIAQGFTFVAAMSDIRMIRQSAAETLKALKR
jgi:4-hydroxy-2-oxoheptanedioate aldolase